MEPITTILIGVCIGLGIGLLVLYSKYSSLSRQLKQEKATHTQQLTETERQLAAEQRQTTSLTEELTETQQQLAAEQRQTTSLTEELTETQQQLAAEQRQTTSLTEELTETQQQLAAEQRQTTSLTEELTETQQQLAAEQRQTTSLTEELTETQQQLAAEQRQTASLTEELTETQQQLAAEQRQTASLTEELTETQQQLAAEQRQTTSLKRRLTRTRGQLKKVQRQTASLTEELTETQERLKDAEEEREDLSQQQKKTRWVLHLSMMSLQGTGVALLKEQKKITDLHGEHIGLIRNYKDLHENIKSKARRRLVKKGGEVILSFIPGLSLISILSDVGEILEAVSAADVIVDNLDEDIGISADFNTAATLSGLTPIVHSNIKDVLQQNMDDADAELNPEALNAFAVQSVRETENFIESELAEEYPESIRVTIDDLEEFIDEVSKYRRTMSDMKENPPPTEA